MDHSTRMLRTLGVLVVSMTGTAALLSWIDPSPAATGPTVSIEELVDAARTAVTERTRPIRGRWAGVQLQAQPASTGAERLLTAQAAIEDVHFTVDENGRCISSELWHRQGFAPDGQPDIRVRIVQTANGEPMSTVQWIGVRALMGALDSVLGNENDLAVSLEPTFGDVYGLEPGTVVQVQPL